MMLRLSLTLALVLLVATNAWAQLASQTALVTYGQPNGTFGAATFGRISATSLSHPNMRQMQLGFKLIF